MPPSVWLGAACSLTLYFGVSSPEAPGYRQLAVSGYRLIYTIEPDTGEADTAGDIRIIAVLGPGQP